MIFCVFFSNFVSHVLVLCDTKLRDWKHTTLCIYDRELNNSWIIGLLQRRFVTCWAKECRFWLWSPIILQPEHSGLKFPCAGMAFWCVPVLVSKIQKSFCRSLWLCVCVCVREKLCGQVWLVILVNCFNCRVLLDWNVGISSVNHVGLSTWRQRLWMKAWARLVRLQICWLSWWWWWWRRRHRC